MWQGALFFGFWIFAAQFQLVGADPPAASVAAKPNVTAVVGVFSGVGPKYTERRAILRSTWFPATADAQQQLLASASLDVRFVVGQSQDTAEQSRILDEERRFGAFFRLEVQETYENLALKVGTTCGGKHQTLDMVSAAPACSLAARSPHQVCNITIRILLDYPNSFH